MSSRNGRNSGYALYSCLNSFALSKFHSMYYNLNLSSGAMKGAADISEKDPEPYWGEQACPQGSEWRPRQLWNL